MWWRRGARSMRDGKWRRANGEWRIEELDQSFSHSLFTISHSPFASVRDRFRMTRPSPLASHLDLLFACRACPNVHGEPVTGAVAGAKVMLVGQAPGPHEREERVPFAYTAGQRLFGWFAPFGVDEAAFRN